MDTPDPKFYADIVTKAADRFRGSAYLVLLATIAIGAFWWSTGYGNWPKYRREWLRSYIGCYDGRKHTSACDRVYRVGRINHMTIEDVRADYDQQQKTISERYTVRIPVLGIDFDRNDLGLLAGVSMVLLLSTLTGNLMRLDYSLAVAVRACSNQPEHLRMLGLAAADVIPSRPAARHAGSVRRGEITALWFPGMLLFSLATLAMVVVDDYAQAPRVGTLPDPVVHVGLRLLCVSDAITLAAAITIAICAIRLFLRTRHRAAGLLDSASTRH